MEYTVSYRIDVEADTPREAALEVEKILRNGHYRPHFSIIDAQDKISEIDLENEEVSEEEKEEKTIYHNYYRCDDCNVEWEDDWDCTCDDECPDCGTPYSPYKSDKIE